MSEPLRPPPARTGLSLVEIMVAVGILSAIMSPIIFTFGAGSRGIQMTNEELIGHTAAIELVEQLQALPFELVPVGDYSDSKIKDGMAMGNGSPMKFRVSDVPEIQRRLSISELRKDGKLKFKKIVVTISIFGRDKKSVSRDVVLKTLMANEQN